jgi:hypothetical protein
MDIWENGWNEWVDGWMGKPWENGGSGKERSNKSKGMDHFGLHLSISHLQVNSDCNGLD